MSPRRTPATTCKRPTISPRSEPGPQSDAAAAAAVPPEPPRGCPLCPRLVAFRRANREAHPDWYNDPVPSFGDPQARLLIIGLAPGLKGANRTGRPFTGDYAGDLLYASLLKEGFARGNYMGDGRDDLQLIDCMVTNAVRCVPPKNRPDASEIAACRPFLAARLKALPQLAVVLALGRIAHDSALACLALPRSAFPFAHGRRHLVGGHLQLFDSYHCSRQNTNTGRLTAAMFEAVLRDIRAVLRSA